MGTVLGDVKYKMNHQSDVSYVRWNSMWDKGERKWILLHAGQIVSAVLGTQELKTDREDIRFYERETSIDTPDRDFFLPDNEKAQMTGAGEKHPET